MLIDPKEKRQREKFMAILLALATRVERGVTALIKPILVSVMLQLRRLVQQMSPDGIFRIYQWQQLQTRAVQALFPLTDTIRTLLPDALAKLEPGIREEAARYLRLPTPPRSIPRPLNSMLEQTQVAGQSLDRAVQQLPVQMAIDLDKTVRTALLRQDSTAEIADKVIKLTTRAGVETPVIRTGSFANRMLNRLMNTVAGATWDVVNRSAVEIWNPASPNRWVWSAVLDPKTCPVCAPLDGQVRRTPAEFPVLPPVHPGCRCVVLPVQPN